MFMVLLSWYSHYKSLPCSVHLDECSQTCRLHLPTPGLHRHTSSMNCQVADVEARQRLHSASSSSLIVGRTRLSTVGDRASPVAAARIWNSLVVYPSTSLLHLRCLFSGHASRLIFLLFAIPVRDRVQCCSCSDTCHFGHSNRSCN